MTGDKLFSLNSSNFWNRFYKQEFFFLLCIKISFIGQGGATRLLSSLKQGKTEWNMFSKNYTLCKM
jgi:hypothetical protein